MKIHVTSFKAIILWSAALTAAALKIIYNLQFSWWWLVFLIAISFTTFKINGRKY